MPIEQLRTFLIIGWCLVAFLLWTTWQDDYGPKPPPVPTTDNRAPAPSQSSTSPAAPADTPQRSTEPSGEIAPAAVVRAEVSPDRQADGIVSVKTDKFIVEISLRGGGLTRLFLRDHSATIDQPDEPFRLLNPAAPDLFVIESGFAVGAKQAKTDIADESTLFQADSSTFELADGAASLEVPLKWTSPGGVEFIKRYTFFRDQHKISLSTEVINNSELDWTAQAWTRFSRTQVVPEGGLFRIYTYTGGVISTPEYQYEKVGFDDLAEMTVQDRYFKDQAGQWQSVPGGWVAMIQHYFTTAIIPGQDAQNYYYSKYRPQAAEYDLGVFLPAQTIQPGNNGVFDVNLYAGPKVQDELESIALNLERTVDYGYLWFLAKPMFWVMQQIHGIIGNWGWAIIILTLLIKLAFFPLSAASYKSMANMRKLGPRLQTLRERYGDDRQRMNQEMMKMYKEEKINPLGGCLPIIVQIPFFIALYWVLIESVELRHAPFILWWRDLSEHDPYFVLPILMGVSMFVQQSLNPKPPDPMQARVMTFLPIVFTFFFLFFPAGLVLYWLCNNVLSIAQQWVINKRLGAM